MEAEHFDVSVVFFWRLKNNVFDGIYSNESALGPAARKLAEGFAEELCSR